MKKAKKKMSKNARFSEKSKRAQKMCKKRGGKKAKHFPPPPVYGWLLNSPAPLPGGPMTASPVRMRHQWEEVRAVARKDRMERRGSPAQRRSLTSFDLDEDFSLTWLHGPCPFHARGEQLMGALRVFHFNNCSF